MKLIIQRVKEARVEINKKVVSSINTGILILVGFTHQDIDIPQTPIWNKIIKKILNLRIFPDQENRLNLSLKQINGDILVVSQFTLYADCKKGNRPSFSKAAPPDVAFDLYKKFLNDLGMAYPGKVKSGKFGEEMFLYFCNWGPVTIILNTENL